MGEVSEVWRIANVTSVFKKGKKEDLGNYRPVLDILSRQLEEKIIRSDQHGLTKGKSYLTNLVIFYDVITGWVGGEREVDVVYIDFS